MSTGFPDWTRAIVLLGWDGASFIPVLLDTDGNLNVLMRGEDGLGALHTVAVDVDGQIIMVPRGSTGNYMNVDASGFLTTILKGIDGATLRTLQVDGSGNLVALIKGSDGVDLQTVAVDTDGQIIMVPRGNTGNYMAVDAAGFLTTVLKGTYGATLTTVAVDVDGKLNAFIYDTVDAWGRTSTVGLSEMAARLGSPITFDRSGQIVLMETFEAGAQRWLYETSGTGATIGITPVYSASGGYSLKAVGGSTFAYIARATVKMGVIPVGRMGFAFAFSTPGNFDRIDCTMYLYTGTIVYSVIWRYKDTNDKIYVVNSAAAEVEVGALKIAPRNAYAFNVTKLIVDLTTGKYVKLLMNATEFDVSAVTMYSGADATAPHISWQITLYSRDGQNDTMYFDNIFITAAEP